MICSVSGPDTSSMTTTSSVGGTTSAAAATTTTAMLMNSFEHGEPAPTEKPAVELICISRKLYDQLVNDATLAQSMMSRFARASGATVELVEHRQQGQRTRPTSGFNNGGSSTNTTGCSSASSMYQHLLHHQQQQQQQQQPQQQLHAGDQQTARREYFIRASGTQLQVDLAREEINKTLRSANAGERVTLKMDVSFSDHSFIIGRLGKGIQGVMRATGCHIHFPDSNRNHRSEKSNQVSVAGPPAGVVAARERIRELLPISLAFMVDKDDYKRAVTTSSESGSTGGRLEPRPKVKNMIETLQNEFRMTITWLPMENFSCAMVTVRGRRSNFERIREGLRRLTAFLRPGQPPPCVHLGIEVSPHHLSFVVGNDDAKLRALMDATRTEFIMAPVRSDTSHHIPTVRIFGQVDDVYQAWLAFMDLLPVVLLIDLPETMGGAAWRGRGGVAEPYRDGQAGGARNLPDDLRPLCRGSPSSPGAGWGHEQQHHNHRITLEELHALRDLGVLSPEALTTAVSAAAEPDSDTTGLLHPGFRSLISMTAQLNSMLQSFEISLTLRLGRDSRHWKMVAKGPERHVDLLMDVYRVLRDPKRDAVALMRDILIATPPPLPYAIPSSSASAAACSSLRDGMTGCAGIIGGAGSPRRLSSNCRRGDPAGLPPVRSAVTSPANGRHHHQQHHYDFGCVPCEALSSQETYRMFSKLLKISRELKAGDSPLGLYAVSPAQSPRAEERRSFIKASMSTISTNSDTTDAVCSTAIAKEQRLGDDVCDYHVDIPHGCVTNRGLPLCRPANVKRSDERDGESVTLLHSTIPISTRTSTPVPLSHHSRAGCCPGQSASSSLTAAVTAMERSLSDTGYFSSPGDEYSPWNRASIESASGDCSTPLRALRSSVTQFGDDPSSSACLTLASASASAAATAAAAVTPTPPCFARGESMAPLPGERRRISDILNASSRPTQTAANNIGSFESLLQDCRGQSGSGVAKLFDAAPGAGRDHRFV